MQTVSSRIWTHVAESISHHDMQYTIIVHTNVRMYVRLYSSIKLMALAEFDR